MLAFPSAKQTNKHQQQEKIGKWKRWKMILQKFKLGNKNYWLGEKSSGHILLEALSGGACITVMAAGLKTVLHAHDIWLHLASVIDEGSVGISLGHQ